MTRADCAIVGSGFSGLCAAGLLAKAGLRVVVLEQAPRLAPLLSGFVRDGLQCDTGFHYSGSLAEGELLAALFRHLGAWGRLELSPAQVTVAWDDGEPLPPAVALEGAGDYLRQVEEIRRRTCFFNLDLDFGAWPEELFDRRTLADALGELGVGPRPSEFIGRYGSVFYGAEAAEVPFHVHALMMGQLFRSATGVRGGGAALAAALLEALRDLGVELVAGDAVTWIETGGGAVKALRLASGDAVECPACVFTAHPGLLPGMLEGVKPSFRKKLLSGEDSFAPDCAYFKAVGQAAGHRLRLWNGGFELESRSGSVLTRFRPVGGGGLAQGALATVGPSDYERWTRTPGGSAYGRKPLASAPPLQPDTAVAGLFLAGQSVKLPGLVGCAVSALLAAARLTDPKRLWRGLRNQA